MVDADRLEAGPTKKRQQWAVAPERGILGGIEAESWLVS
jgi:hypothetical protein